MFAKLYLEKDYENALKSFRKYVNKFRMVSIALMLILFMSYFSALKDPKMLLNLINLLP